MKIRKLFKRAAALALAAVTALSVVPATTAFAAGDIGTISFTHTYDGAGNAMRYNSSANIGGHTAGGTGEYKYRMYVDGETAFCLQPGVPLKTGNTLAKASSNAWNALSAEQRKAVGLALLYGYQGNSGNLSGSDDEKLREIPISEIDEFPDHPFKVLMNEDMEQLVESVSRSGVMTPATVRQKEDGRYELISGHRRKKACELAGIETLKCEVKELTHDEAIIVMVESNLQRSVILPSEKAFAYKMRLEAMKRQGERSDLTSRPVGEKLFSVDKMSQDVADSGRQIHRYIRLTELVPEILQMVDERQIAFRPAVEISYLSEEQQYTLLEAMGYNDATPSLAQAIKMKKFMQEGKLTDEVIQSIMQEDKPNQKEKPAFKDERITKLIPKSIPRGQETDFVVKALEFYNRHLQRNKAHER